MLPSGLDHIVTQVLPSDVTNATHNPDTRSAHAISQCARVDTRRDLADTGASVSATGRLDILHHFTPHTPYEIMGYDGTVTRAAGQGTVYVRSPEKEELEEMFFVYIPSVDGTIISLEHHTRTHPSIHKWTQEAIPTSDAGWVTFRDVNDAVVSRYKTKQEKGLYYIQDLEFYPVTSATIASCHMCDNNMNSDTLTVKTRPSSVQTQNCIDFVYDLAMMNEADQLTLVPHWTTPMMPSRIAVLQCRASTHMEKDILNFELWHQRLAHCSEKRLRYTQKLVDGISAFYGPKIPGMVTFRTCDVAKLRKAPRGRILEDGATLENGQEVFQMDRFIRGPLNLDNVLARTEDADTKIIESRNGFVCYLLIVDRKTRYMWPFPLKSKSVPLELLRTFLTIHGHLTCHNKCIRTDGEGSIAESQQCHNMLTKLGYTMQRTATDSSSQNGLAERPHQTLATMVRCLLYSSSLPVTFWADALVYATYINNRLYHSGVEDIPFTLWTGRRPDMKHMRAFGAHVSVRRGGSRPTKTDPHYYDGRFLRFAATTRNIVYFDTTTKRENGETLCCEISLRYATRRSTNGCTVSPGQDHSQSHPPYRQICGLRISKNHHVVIELELYTD